MIKKIDIENLATFKNLQWDESLDKNVEFKKINILYGQNASGKTTLSRILRALETGKISNKYDSPQFTLTCTDSTTIDQNKLKEHQLPIRVFNQDFVKENLHFFTDEEKDITSFILGMKNIEIHEEKEKLILEWRKIEKKTKAVKYITESSSLRLSSQERLNLLSYSMINKLIYPQSNECLALLQSRKALIEALANNLERIRRENIKSNRRISQMIFQILISNFFKNIENGKYGKEAKKIFQNSKNITDPIKKPEQEIKKLEDQFSDQSFAAEKINDYLKVFFTSQRIKIVAVKDKPQDKEYKFEIQRNGKKAFHLSEGERSFIAFCYFMAKLKDRETQDKQPIIWIDDPVSSLDSNHIFSVYSLIHAQLFLPREESYSFNQLFISTHSLEFLKYLKQLPKDKKKEHRYLTVVRDDQKSRIELMPKYLKDYTTEFHYLFEQIYLTAFPKNDSCEEGKTDEIDSILYNFGNNARKFLETFLFFKYPDSNNLGSNLSKFFEKDYPLINRIVNEGSHASLLEESIKPIVSREEIKNAAKTILRRICEKDKEQYIALCKSIGQDSRIEDLGITGEAALV